MRFTRSFPTPKLIKLFDLYFPKTKGHQEINWRKILQAWAKWAPWITILLLILICSISVYGNEGIGPFAFIAFVGSFLNFVYYLVLVCFAKLVKRSPQVLFALMPRVPLVCFVILSVYCQLASISDRVSRRKVDIEPWKERHEESAQRR